MTLSRIWPAVLLVTAVVGCASLDPQPRIQEAAERVRERLGESPAWDLPWEDPSSGWVDHAVLTLDEAVTLALRNNRELRADLETIGEAQADVVQAGLIQNPVVNFMAMFPDGGGRAMLRSNALPMLPLQDLWLRPVRQGVAQARLQQTVLRVSDRAVETAAAVKRTYAGIQYAQRASEIIHENMDIVERSTQLIQTRQVAGKATQVEVNLSRIRRLQLKSELLAMQAEAQSSKRELLALIGSAGASDDWTVAGIHELHEIVPAGATEDAALATAQSSRLDLLAAQWDLQAAERQVQLARREGWPDISLGLAFERAPALRAQDPTRAGQLGNAAYRAATEDISAPEPTLPFSPKTRELKYTTGPMLEMELPLFDRNQAQVAKSLHEYQGALAEYDGKRQAVIMNVRRTLVTLNKASEQVRFFREEILPEVEQNLRLVEQSYRSGQDALTVYLQVYEDLLMNRLKLLEHLRDVLVSRVELERQVGGSLQGTNDAPPPPSPSKGG